MNPQAFAVRAAASAALSTTLFLALGDPALARHKNAEAPPAAAAPAATTAPSGPSAADMIPALEAQLKTSPTDTNVKLRLAEAYYQVGKSDRTLALCQEILNAGVRKTAAVYFFQGAALRALGRVNDSIAPFEQAASLDPTSSLVLVELSNAYLQLNRPDDAYRVAKRASTFNTTDPRVFLNYGVVLAVKKDFDGARGQFATAAKLAPADTLPLLLTARTFLDQSRYDDAQKAYDGVLAKDANNEAALQGKMQIALARHRPDDAVAIDEKLFANARNEQAQIEILNDEARIYLAEKQTDKAAAVLRREVATFPNNPLVHISQGDFFLALGKQKEAIAEWNVAVGPKQDNQVALMRLGMLALRNGDGNTASTIFTRLTALDSKDDAAWFHLGQSYQLQNKFDRALDSFKRAFALRQTVQSYADIATCEYALHNYREAAQIFDKLSVQAAPFLNGNPSLLFVAGKSYDAAHQPQKARSAYNRILAFVKPGSSDEKTIRSLLAGLGKPAAASAAHSHR